MDSKLATKLVVDEDESALQTSQEVELQGKYSQGGFNDIFGKYTSYLGLV